MLQPLGWAAAARMVGCNSETLRRQCTSADAKPSLETVVRVSECLNLNANWILFGVLPSNGRDLRQQIVALTQEAQPDELVAYVGIPLERASATPLVFRTSRNGAWHPARAEACEIRDGTATLEFADAINPRHPVNRRHAGASPVA